MSRPVIVCRLDETADVAAGKMWDHDCGALPVVDDEGRLCGMVTDRDLCMAAYTRGTPLREIGVGSVMSGDVRSCRAEDSIGRVETMMANNQVRRIPVVDGGAHPVGMVTLNDLARIAAGPGTSRTPEASDGVTRTLAAVAQPRAPQG